MRRAVAALVLVLAACGGEPQTGNAPAEAVVVTQAPPGTDIWLAELSRDDDGTLSIGDPVNVTSRPGYDNQPAFLPDGSAFLYTVIDDEGQADIWRYDLAADSATQVTHSRPESEYSGTPLPDGGFSAVRVEADSTQRLWRFQADGTGATLLFPGIAPVGYHAWADDSTAVLYVLGEPPTLQIAHLGGGAPQEVARDVGRSIQTMPGGGEVSYVQRMPEGATEIRALDVATGKTRRLIGGVQGGDFHAWTPDGTLLQAYEGGVYAWRPGQEDWRRIADLASLGIRVSRMAVSADGTRIALVGETAS